MWSIFEFEIDRWLLLVDVFSVAVLDFLAVSHIAPGLRVEIMVTTLVKDACWRTHVVYFLHERSDGVKFTLLLSNEIAIVCRAWNKRLVIKPCACL